MKRSDRESGKAGSVSGVQEPAALLNAVGTARRVICGQRPDISEQELEHRTANAIEEFYVVMGGAWRPGEREDAQDVLEKHEGLLVRIAVHEAIDSIRRDPWRERPHGQKSAANIGGAAPGRNEAGDAARADELKARRSGRPVSVGEATQVGDKSPSESEEFERREHYEALLNRIRVFAIDALAELRAEVDISCKSREQRIKRLAKLERAEALFNEMMERAANPNGPSWTYTQLGELVLGKSGKDVRKRIAADLAILIDRIAERFSSDELLD